MQAEFNKDEQENILKAIIKLHRELPYCSDVFNWQAISKISLPDSFIDKFWDKLIWDTMSQYQAFSLYTVEKFLPYINFHFMSKNPNVRGDVLKKYSSRMDWEAVQSNIKLTPALLEHFSESLDDVLIFKYQKLDEAFIISRLSETQEQQPISNYLQIIFQYQTVSEEFINKFSTINIATVTRYQKLSEQFIIDNYVCVSHPDKEILENIATYQKLTNDFILKYRDVFDPKIILRHQLLSDIVLKTYYDEFSGFSGFAKLKNLESPENPKLELENIIVRYQRYGIHFLIKMLTDSEQCVSSVNISKWRSDVYITVFMRSFLPIEDPQHLGFSSTVLEQYIVPNIDWDRLVMMKLSENEIDFMIKQVPEKIQWYSLIKYNSVTEQQLTKLTIGKYLSAMDWWLALSNGKNKFSTSFVEQHSNKKKWWKFVQNPQRFYASCLEDINSCSSMYSSDFREGLNSGFNSGLGSGLETFLSDFVDNADWKYILRHEQLPDWFIAIFAHSCFASKIDMYWWKITYYQQLSESFIKKNLENLDINVVVGRQELSVEFFKEFGVYMDECAWKSAKQFQKFTPEEWQSLESFF